MSLEVVIKEEEVKEDFRRRASCGRGRGHARTIGYPYVVEPDITIAEAATPRLTLRLLLYDLKQ